MVTASLALVLALTASANAHFRLQYPLPRGPFVADDEVNFCDNYIQATTNRSDFPLNGGFLSLISGHNQFVVGAVVSTVPTASSFDDFHNSSGGFQFAVPYFKVENNGSVCAPVNFGTLGFSGIQDGANVTLQVIFQGGDGNLYQCADLTLRANYSIPSDISCANITGTSTPSSSSASATSPAPSATQSTASGAISAQSIVGVTTVLAAIGAAFFVL